MIDQIPMLHEFCRLYWNENGFDAYGSIENAFSELINDCLKLPHPENSLIKLREELDFVAASPSYTKWVEDCTNNLDTIRALGGRVIWPDEVGQLILVLDAAVNRISH